MHSNAPPNGEFRASLADLKAFFKFGMMQNVAAYFIKKSDAIKCSGCSLFCDWLHNNVRNLLVATWN